MNNRMTGVIIACAFAALWFWQPISVGPALIFLLLKPMYLASQAISVLEEGVAIGYTIPDWFNSCLDESSQIVQGTGNQTHLASEAVK